MSTRNTILSNLETALLGITVAAGYNTDIAAVYRHAMSQNELDSSVCPAVSIVDDGAERPEGNVGANWWVTATITLEGVVRHSSNSPTGAELSEMFNDFLADVRKCIHATDLGANVLYARPGELRAITGDAVIYFQYQLEILYYYSEDTP
jgi:hypothetical protein